MVGSTRNLLPPPDVEHSSKSHRGPVSVADQLWPADAMVRLNAGWEEELGKLENLTDQVSDQLLEIVRESFIPGESSGHNLLQDQLEPDGVAADHPQRVEVLLGGLEKRTASPGSVPDSGEILGGHVRTDSAGSPLLCEVDGELVGESVLGGVPLDTKHLALHVQDPRVGLAGGGDDLGSAADGIQHLDDGALLVPEGAVLGVHQLASHPGHVLVVSTNQTVVHVAHSDELGRQHGIDVVTKLRRGDLGELQQDTGRDVTHADHGVSEGNPLASDGVLPDDEPHEELLDARLELVVGLLDVKRSSPLKTSPLKKHFEEVVDEVRPLGVDLSRPGTRPVVLQSGVNNNPELSTGGGRFLYPVMGTVVDFPSLALPVLNLGLRHSLPNSSLLVVSDLLSVLIVETSGSQGLLGGLEPGLGLLPVVHELLVLLLVHDGIATGDGLVDRIVLDAVTEKLELSVMLDRDSVSLHGADRTLLAAVAHGRERVAHHLGLQEPSMIRVPGLRGDVVETDGGAAKLSIVPELGVISEARVGELDLRMGSGQDPPPTKTSGPHSQSVLEVVSSRLQVSVILTNDEVEVTRGSLQ